MTDTVSVIDHKFEEVISVVRGLAIDDKELVAEMLRTPRANAGSVYISTVDLKNCVNPAVVAMKRLVSDQVFAFCDRYDTGHSSIEIAECWGHISEHGDSVPSHVHPTSFVSAVYYPEVIQGSCNLRFERPNWAAMAYQIMRFRPKQAPLTRQYIDISPCRGTLVISPSWLPRGVSTTASVSGGRASVVFKFGVSGENANKPCSQLLLGVSL